MAVRTDITVDWSQSPRIIEVAAPSTQITIQDLVDTLRALEDDLENLQYDQIISAAGKEELGGGVLVGVTATLLNALLQFEARPGPTYTQCSVAGGNLVAVDDAGVTQSSPINPTAFTQVLITASSSATLQELGAIQFSSYGGGVTVDAINGTPGTVFPQGTEESPVDNLADALTIASERGFKAIYFKGSFTFVSGDNVAGYELWGEAPSRSTLTFSSGTITTGAELFNASIEGTVTAPAGITGCHIGNITGDSNLMNREIDAVDCLLEGTITLSSGLTGEIQAIDCNSGVPGMATPTLDFNGADVDMLARNYSGGIRLQNINQGQEISIDMNSGQVILDSTVTNANITIRGVGKLVDNSVGASVTNELIDSAAISGLTSPWDSLISNHTTVGSFGWFIQKLLTVSKFIGLK